MKYFCKINSREIAFSLDAVGKSYRLSSYDGDGEIEITLAGVDLYHILMDGKSKLVSVVKAGEEYRVVMDGKELPVTVENARARLKRLHGGGKSERRNIGRITAQIPGLVVRVIVSEGDSVEEGDPLMALEAMKMENEIKSPVSGSVKQIAVSQGDSVPNGALLMVIE